MRFDMRNERNIIKNIKEFYNASNDAAYIFFTIPHNLFFSSGKVGPTPSLSSKRVAPVSNKYRLNHCFEGVNPAPREFSLDNSTTPFQHSNVCNEHDNSSKIISGEMIKFNQAHGRFMKIVLGRNFYV